MDPCFKRLADARLAIFAATMMLAAPAVASAGAGAASNTLPLDADRSAIATIVMSSVAEVQLCQLADAKTRNPDVRAFCRSAANDSAHIAIQGLQLAQALGANEVKFQPLPGTPAILDSLAQYAGHDFDRAFLLAQIEHRENDRQALRYAAEVTTNTAVKRYEDSVIPKAERYLQLAESALHTISENDP